MSRSLVGRALVALVLSVVSGGLAPRALAVEGEVLFEDNFEMVDPTFGEPSDELFAENNELVVKLEKNLWYRLSYQSMIFDDIDATVRVQLPDWSAETGGGVGMMFWTVDNNNTYVFELSDSGTFAVRRMTTERTLNPITWRTSDAIKTEPGAWNELRVVTHGNRATLYINGTEVATLRGRMPEGGSLIGLFLETYDEAGERRFADLKVVEPAAVADDVATNDPGLILADDFASFDPMWGAESTWLGVRDGQLFIDFNPNESYTSYNMGAIATGDVDATVTVTVGGEPGDANSDAGAGLVFWGTDYANFYLFQVNDDGTMIVFRRVGERWLTPMAVKQIPAGAKFDLTQGAELRVVTSGRKATLYINGVEVGVISGQPPKDESLVGLYGQSGEAAGATLFDNLMIRQPAIN